MVGIFHFAPEPTTLCVAGFACMMLLVGYLIDKSEKRQAKALKAHEDMSQAQVQCITDGIGRLEKMALENQRSSIRIEMNSYIRNEPDNHDTILAYAEKYFVELNGDWKETDKFMEWVDKENAAGRPVHIPPMLLSNVSAKQAAEQK